MAGLGYRFAFIFLLASTLLLVAGCATPSRQISTEDRAVFGEIYNKYEQCLGRHTDLLMDGSDDVAYLTQVILSNCDSHLISLEKTIVDRGISQDYASRYVLGTRKLGDQITSSFILREKAKAKAAVLGSAAQQ